MDLKFRKLRKDEVKVRVQSVNQWNTILLLYKDARCDMNILDESVGPMNWKRDHTRDNKNCIVSIWDGGKAQWVSKEDTGTQSNTEKEKGLASDSFKRACTNWGIGRELYETPKLKIKNDKVTVKQDGNKYKTYDEFRVASITYDRYGHVDGLAIKNQNGKVIFMQEPKDPNWADEKEDIPPVETTEETIISNSEPKIEHVETSFDEPVESDIIKEEPKQLNAFEQKAQQIQQQNQNVIDEEGPGF